MGLVGDLVSWGVLHWCNGSTCDRFTLGEEVWKLLTSSLAWLEPIDGKCLIGGHVANLDLYFFSWIAPVFEIDLESVSQVLV